MVTFKEYYQGDKMMSSNATSITGQCGNKSLMSGDRKHQNLTRQEYISKCPHVNKLINGNMKELVLLAQSLTNTLMEYGVDFVPNVTKSLCKGIDIDMYEDDEGRPCGKLRKNK